MSFFNIAILDNDLWSARSIAQWISDRSPSHKVIWYSTNTAQAIHRCLFDSVKPDVLILDMALGSMSGTSVCAHIRKQTPHIGIIGMTAYDPLQYEDDLIKAGAQTLIAKESIAASLPSTISTVAQGNTPYPQRFMTTQQAYEALNEQDNVQFTKPQLSRRELQIIYLYAQDNTTSDIARQCNISINTVFTYMHRAQQKLGVNNRTEVITLCKKYDLIQTKQNSTGLDSLQRK